MDLFGAAVDREKDRENGGALPMGFIRGKGRSHLRLRIVWLDRMMKCSSGDLKMQLI